VNAAVTTSGSIPAASLEVFAAGGASGPVAVTGDRFEIGRGSPGADRLALDDVRISRQAALIVYENGEFRIRDLGQRKGLLLNDRQVRESALADGDVITFGNTDAVHVVFRTGPGRGSLTSLLSRLDESARTDAVDQNLQQLSLLLEAMALFQTGMPAGEILGAMVDQAIRITEAERGALFEADSGGNLRALVARRAGGIEVHPSSWVPSRTAIDRALADRRAFIELDLDLAGDTLKMAASIVSQQLRSVIAIPLYSRIPTTDPGTGALLGALYLDSRRPAAFRGLGRRVLDALAIEAASVIDNARMVERERERRQMELDLSIARDIQQRLLPKQFRSYASFEITGTNRSCYSVGGDYFDVVEPEPGRVAFVVADVTGKGLSAALLTAMLQGGFSGISLTPDLARLVGHLNRYVWGRSEPNRFATAFVGVLDEDGRLEYINAGHLPALLVRASGATIQLASDSLPIGVFPDTTFTSRQMTLAVGDTLVVFTDGVTEATNTADEEFGMARLTSLLAAHANGTVGESQDAVLAAVGRFSEGREQDDDMTLLVVRYIGVRSGTDPHRSPGAGGQRGGASASE